MQSRFEPVLIIHLFSKARSVDKIEFYSAATFLKNFDNETIGWPVIQTNTVPRYVTRSSVVFPETNAWRESGSYGSQTTLLNNVFINVLFPSPDSPALRLDDLSGYERLAASTHQ